MKEEEIKDKMEEHYICLGGCRQVSKDAGVCNMTDCDHFGHELIRCHCKDGLHNNFKATSAI